MKVLKLVEKRGQSATGFTDVYTSINQESPRAAATVFYLPQFNESSKHVVLTLLLEKPKEMWTDGEISDILLDVESEVRKFESEQFETLGSVKYIDTQFIYIDNIDGFLFHKCGDCTFLDKED